MSFLAAIKFILPSRDTSFIESFVTYLSPQGKCTNNGIDLRISNAEYLPKTSFQFVGEENPYVLFLFSDNNKLKVAIENTTKVTKKSPYSYAHISLEDFIKRMAPFSLVGLDHTGFNLPYFDGIYPQIVELREKLKNACLYHTFPKHLEDAPWDFIIPGTKEEIERTVSVDYHRIRKPKFEIVSFENSSIPLIQIDIQIQAKYEDLAKTFPEALHAPEIKNMWIYIGNNIGIDICFVLNEVSENDWSYQFAKERIG